MVKQGVQAIKKALKKIWTGKELQQVVCDLNSLEYSHVPATPSEMMADRVVRSLLPGSGRMRDSFQVRSKEYG